MASVHEIMRSLKSYVVSVTGDLKLNEDDLTYLQRTVILGWPSRTNQLKTALQKGQTIISIFPAKDMERNLTPYFGRPFVLAETDLDIFFDTSGTDEVEKRISTGLNATLTIGSESGEIVAGEIIVVSISRPPNLGGDIVASIPTVLVDTTSTIATKIALAIDNLNLDYIITSVTDNVITLSYEVAQDAPEYEKIIFRASNKKTLGVEVARKQKFFLVSIWAPSPTIREIFGERLESKLSTFESGDTDSSLNRLVLDSGECVSTQLGTINISDEEQEQKNFMETIQVIVEYSIIRQLTGTDIMATPHTLEILFPPGTGQNPLGKKVPILCTYEDVIKQLEQISY